MESKYGRFIFYNTFRQQLEITPRLTIIYNAKQNEDDYYNELAIEWLWFDIFVNI